MKIALYHPWIHLKGGGEKVILELMENGSFDYDLYTNYYKPEKTFKEFESIDVNNLTPDAKMRGVLQRGLTFGLQYILPTKLNLEDYDAFLVSTGGIAELITYRNHQIPTFSYCHTPLRAAHDEDYATQYMTGDKGILYKLLFQMSKWGYKRLESPAWGYFDRVFANSKNTKGRLTGGNLVEEDKVDVVNPGADIDSFKPKGEFNSVFFVPGRINKYKRQGLAIESYKKFRRENDNFKLVVAGFVASKDKDYYKEIEEMSEGYEDIEIIANPTDKRYMNLYQNCYAVLFTAVNEDWGLTPIEANACGKLVISVNEGGPQESIDDGNNGFLVNSADEFAEKMLYLADNLELVKSQESICREEAKEYSWDNFTDRLETAILAGL